MAIKKDTVELLKATANYLSCCKLTDYIPFTSLNLSHCYLSNIITTTTTTTNANTIIIIATLVSSADN